MTIKLTDLQRVLLSAAHARDTGSILPAPECVAGDGARVDRAIASLRRRKLVARDDEEVILTNAGRVALEGHSDNGAQAGDGAADAPIADTPAGEGGSRHGSADTKVSETAPGDGTKSARLVKLLQHPDGASLDQLAKALGWLPHTTRAALTGLRKKGYAVTSDREEGVRRYRIATGATA
jgi:biotin operon repressor